MASTRSPPGLGYAHPLVTQKTTSPPIPDSSDLTAKASLGWGGNASCLWSWDCLSLS